MKAGFDHIHLRCQDLEAAVRFYVENLGAKVEEQYEAAGMPITLINLGGAVVALSPPRQGVEVKVPGEEPGWGLYQIGITVDDLEAAQAELAAKGVEFCRGPVQLQDNLRAAFIDGPDGVEIELMERS